MNADGHQFLRLQRIFRAPAERVFNALIDPGAIVKWLPPHGFTGHFDRFEAKIGSGYRMSFTNLGSGQSHWFECLFTEINAPTRLVYKSWFEGQDPASAMHVELNLRPVLCGTELCLEQARIPAQIPLEYCYAGWQESLQLLALLVEADLPADV